MLTLVMIFTVFHSQKTEKMDPFVSHLASVARGETILSTYLGIPPKQVGCLDTDLTKRKIYNNFLLNDKEKIVMNRTRPYCLPQPAIEVGNDFFRTNEHSRQSAHTRPIECHQ